MYFNKRKRAPKILKLLVVVLSLGASICFSADKTDIRVGIIDSFNPEFATTTLEPTLRYLNQKLPNYHFVAVPLNSVNPKKELKNNPIDFLISSAGTFHELSISIGIVHIATRKTILSDDPSASEGAAFVTLAKRADLIGQLLLRMCLIP